MMSVRIYNFHGEILEVELEQRDDAYGYDLPGYCFVAIGRDRASAERNVTFMIQQAIYFLNNDTLFRYFRQAGVYMPPEYDWSFIRDAEPEEKMRLARCLVGNNRIRNLLRGTFSHTIALNLGIWTKE